MTSEQVKELVEKTLMAHHIEAEGEEAYAPNVDEQLAIARLVDGYTKITAVVAAEGKWRLENERKVEVFTKLLEKAEEHIQERGVPLVLMQMLVEVGAPQDTHVPPGVRDLASQMGADVVCGCPECTTGRKRDGH